MKITFLGTGPAINIPRRGCSCPTCEDARRPQSKSKRANSSVLIQNNGAAVLIDCTPDFKKQILQTKNSKLKAVFLTHAHKDAAGGIKQLSHWLEKNKFQTALYLHKATAQKLKIKNKKSKTQIKNIKIILIKPYQSIKINNLKILSFPVHHGLKKYPTFGYLINNKIIYASDMDGAPKKSLKYFRRADVLILDASMWFGKHIKGHFNVEEAINFTTELSTPGGPRRMTGRKLFLTHVGHTFPPHEKAQKEVNRYLKKTPTQGRGLRPAPKIPLKATLAYGGMKIKI